MIDLTKLQRVFPSAFVAVNAHIQRMESKYEVERTAPLEPPYIGIAYSIPKLSRHYHSMLAGNMVDPESGSHQAAAIAWHALNILNEYELAKAGTLDDGIAVNLNLYGE